MARTKYSQVTAQPRFAPSGARPGSSRRTVYLMAAALAAVIIGGASLTTPGMRVISAVHWFLEFYVGVFSLVSLSLAVMVGLVATDRIVLLIRHRVLLQAVHRAMATTSVVCLALHVFLKVLEGHASVVDVVIPFLASHRVVYVGLGTIASYLMIVIFWTGVIRGRFAGSARPWVWRALHATAYLCWPVALIHGLEAGRSAKTWVIVSYALCLILVGVALAVRLSVTWSKRLSGPKVQTTGTMRPVGSMGPIPPAVSIALTMPGAPEPVSAAPVTAVPVTAVPAEDPPRPARHRVTASVPVPPRSRHRIDEDPPVDPADDDPVPARPEESGEEEHDYFSETLARHAPVADGLRPAPPEPGYGDDGTGYPASPAQPARTRRRPEPAVDEDEPAYYGEPRYPEPSYARTGGIGPRMRRPRRLSEAVATEPCAPPPEPAAGRGEDPAGAPVPAAPVRARRPSADEPPLEPARRADPAPRGRVRRAGRAAARPEEGDGGHLGRGVLGAHARRGGAVTAVVAWPGRIPGSRRQWRRRVEGCPA